MNSLQDISESLDNAFCERQINFAGIVEFAKSRNGTDIVDVLRKITQERIFVPVVWDGGILAFIMLDTINYNESRRGIGEATLVVISSQYGDHETVLKALDKYDFPKLSLNLNSQSIYDKFFVEDNNKPFQGFAFELKFDFNDDVKLCCESFEKKLC